MNRPTALAAVAVPVALVIGFSAGWSLRLPRAPVVARPPPRIVFVSAPTLCDPEPIEASADVRGDTLLDRCIADRRRLEEEAEALETLGRMQLIGLTGTEVPWSFNTDPAYAPDAILRAIEQSEATCPGTWQGEIYVDCDEYPCLVWSQSRRSLPTDCVAWPYGVPTMFGGSRLPNGDWQDYAILAAMPREESPPFGYDDLQKRLAFRREWNQEIVFEEWAAEDP